MSGIGGKGPAVDHDCMIKLQWSCDDERWTAPVEISCGVVPDYTFPGDLTLGRSIFHFLGLGQQPKAIEHRRMPDYITSHFSTCCHRGNIRREPSPTAPLAPQYTNLGGEIYTTIPRKVSGTVQRNPSKHRNAGKDVPPYRYRNARPHQDPPSALQPGTGRGNPPVYQGTRGHHYQEKQEPVGSPAVAYPEEGPQQGLGPRCEDHLAHLLRLQTTQRGDSKARTSASKRRRRDSKSCRPQILRIPGPEERILAHPDVSSRPRQDCFRHPFRII